MTIFSNLLYLSKKHLFKKYNNYKNQRIYTCKYKEKKLTLQTCYIGFVSKNKLIIYAYQN